MDLKMIRYLAIFACIVLSSNGASLKNNQGRSVRLNPYTMKYIQQMMSRGGFKAPQKLSSPYRPRNAQPPKVSLQPMKSSQLTIQPLGVKPLLVKPVYGKTYLNVGSKRENTNNQVNSGQYTFAQVQPKGNNKNKKVNPIMVALPNLGNLLYKYAKKQVESRKTPVYNQNLYKMFGRQTYGPMPMPTGTTYTVNNNPPPQRHSSRYAQAPMQSYHQPVPAPAPQPAIYSPPAAPIQSEYDSQMSYQQPSVIVNAPAQKQMGYSSMPGQGNIHIGGYGDGGSDWGGMLYISGPADEIVNIMQQPKLASSSGSMSSYTPTVAQKGYGQPQTSKSSGYVGAGTTCTPVPTNFCHSQKPGHFTSPGSRHCFIQCDAFGRGYNKECAPGTTWNVRGPEPALYNMCS